MGTDEGLEHAHQEGKRFFLQMSCHSTKHADKYGGPQMQVMRQGVVKAQLCRERSSVRTGERSVAHECLQACDDLGDGHARR